MGTISADRNVYFLATAGVASPPVGFLSQRRIMSSINGKPGRPSNGANPQQRRESKLAAAPCTAADEIAGDWPRERLIRMNERFVERMQRAIARGLERPDGVHE